LTSKFETHISACDLHELEDRMDRSSKERVLALIFTGFLEEFIFRGMMQQATIQTMGRLGLIYTSAVFAVLHIGYQSILDVIFVFVVGWFFALIVQKTHSIWGVTLAHGLTNISLFLIFPFIF